MLSNIIQRYVLIFLLAGLLLLSICMSGVDDRMLSQGIKKFTYQNDSHGS
jgi:hypothetical protein